MSKKKKEIYEVQENTLIRAMGISYLKIEMQCIKAILDEFDKNCNLSYVDMKAEMERYLIQGIDERADSLRKIKEKYDGDQEKIN